MGRNVLGDRDAPEMSSDRVRAGSQIFVRNEASEGNPGVGTWT